jgi:hypothetical protein
MLAAPAHANECDKLAYLTFSAPVELAGVVLPPGTYQFTHPDCEMSERILRVSSVDGKTVYGTFFTVPEQRVTASSRAEVVLAEMPAGSPEAITAWFYPGDSIGDRLLYPNNEAAKILKAPEHKIFATNTLA